MKKFQTKEEMRLERWRQNSTAWRASESGSQASETWRFGDLGLPSLPPLRSLCPHPQLTPRPSPGHVVAPGAEQWDRVPGRDAEQYCAIRGLGGRAGRRAKCTAYCIPVGIICCCCQRGGGEVSDPAPRCCCLPAAPTVASARRSLHGYLPSCTERTHRPLTGTRRGCR
jgi:hypothetical protein